MALNLDAIQVIVYDLDGTVYDDTTHFELYAKEIQGHLPAQKHESFWEDYSRTIFGKHPALRVGTFYDVKRDLILVTKHGEVTRALHWDGSELPPIIRREFYKEPLQPDFHSLINVGDLWWVPAAISFHYGGEVEKHQQAFLRIRDVMSDPEYRVRPIPELAQTLESLRGKVVQVLATNSPQPDSESILTKVDLMGRFDKMYFNSGKPMGLKRIFEEVAAQYGVPMSAILSVGDNLVNEISPARAMGCQTVFIDPFGLAEADDADMIIGEMVDLLPTLRELAAKR